jgi:hypothetical protein
MFCQKVDKYILWNRLMAPMSTDGRRRGAVRCGAGGSTEGISLDDVDATDAAAQSSSVTAADKKGKIVVYAAIKFFVDN